MNGPLSGYVNFALNHAYGRGPGIYGSELSNGADQTTPIGTGLFALNSGLNVTPSFILDWSTGYSFAFNGKVVRPQLYVDHVLDNHYLLKGAFFSGAARGRARTVELRVNVGR